MTWAVSAGHRWRGARSSRQVGSGENDDAQVLGDRTMNIAIFTTWALLVTVIAGSKFCARRASCSAIAIADNVQKLGRQAGDRR